MRALTLIFTLLLACLVSVTPAAAQEGHPVKGSWLGTWDGNTVHGNDIVVVMNWDGKAITGTINPGTDNIAIKNATLDPATWTLRFEADAKDAKGAAVTYKVEGKIENLAFHNRSISGTWQSARGKGAFKIQRQ